MLDSRCSSCGETWPQATAPWPRECAWCSTTTWKNPVPVAVVIAPILGPVPRLLAVRRAIEPAVGKLALPGGYMDVGETWQQSAVRELREEVGVEVTAADVRLVGAETVITAVPNYATPRTILLLFCQVPPMPMPEFRENHEVSEIVAIEDPSALCFSTHTETAARWFRKADENARWSGDWRVDAR